MESNNHNSSPDPLNSKDKGTKINPDFDFNLIYEHVEALAQTPETTPHTEILNQLIEQIEPLDFVLLAFPEIEQLRADFDTLEKMLANTEGSINTKDNNKKELEQWKDLKKQIERLKLSTKHYYILSIDNVLQVAENKQWNICMNLGFIYLYNSAFWSNIDKEAFQKFLGRAALKMGVTKFQAKDHKFRDLLFKQFLSEAYLPTPEPAKDSVFINLKNGTFEITPTGTRLREFDSKDFLTYQLPFDYNPEAKAPQFEAYLNKVLPDIQSQNILAEYLGYVFTRTMNLEKMLLLHGSGANGKSVFMNIVNALYGSENVSSYSLQSLTDDKGYHRAKLANILVNYASEINGKLETDFFKQLVSGEPIEARLPYGEPFMLKNYAKLVFNCNELPKDVEHNNAYFRRFLIIPFNVTIPEADQDRQLSQKIIKTELSGVFNWVLTGLNRLLKNQKFSECEAANRAREQFERESDSVKLFLDETGYQIDATGPFCLIKDLYPEYKGFCNSDGITPVKKTNFIKRLINIGVLVEKRNVGNVAYLIVPRPPG